MNTSSKLSLISGDEYAKLNHVCLDIYGCKLVRLFDLVVFTHLNAEFIKKDNIELRDFYGSVQLRSKFDLINGFGGNYESFDQYATYLNNRVHPVDPDTLKQLLSEVCWAVTTLIIPIFLSDGKITMLEKRQELFERLGITIGNRNFKLVSNTVCSDAKSVFETVNEHDRQFFSFKFWKEFIFTTRVKPNFMADTYPDVSNIIVEDSQLDKTYLLTHVRDETFENVIMPRIKPEK